MNVSRYCLIGVALAFSAMVGGENGTKKLTLDEVVCNLSLQSSPARMELLSFQSELLQYENYRKGFLPSLAFNFNPVNFNRSLKLLQDPEDGSYSNVEDYSNTTNLGITVSQKVYWTGGKFSVGSSLNYLREFPQKRNSFSSVPFTIGYTQDLWGGTKANRLERRIENARRQVAVKSYCSRLSEIQQETLDLFLSALLNKMTCRLAEYNKQTNDTLLQLGRTKLSSGHITEYDLKQIELQYLNACYDQENALKNYKETLRELSTYLDLEEECDVEVPVFDLPLDVDKALVEMYVRRNNPFYMEQEINKFSAEQELHNIRASTLFNGNISLNYGLNQYADNISEVYRRSNVQQSVMIGFQIPVFQWGINRNKIRIARNAYEIARLNIEKSRKDFENEIGRSVDSYRHSVNMWFTSERAYRLSQEQVRILVAKFRWGKVSVYEMIEAQRELYDAMQRYYSSMKDVYTNYFTLRHLALYDFKERRELEDLFILKH